MFFGLGYALSIFLTPADLGISGEELSSEKIADLAEGSEKPKTENSSLVKYAEGSYLTELDLLDIPGQLKPLGFKVDLAISNIDANQLIEDLQPYLAASKARYLTGSNKQAVLVLAGSYSDYDEANIAKRELSQSIKNSLEIIYLPDCVVEGSVDDEGFVCSPPPEEDTQTES